MLFLQLKKMHQTKDIDSKRIFMLGHSLGATLAPRIGLQDHQLAGLIMMARITRSLEETHLDSIYLYLWSDRHNDRSAEGGS